MALFAHGFRPFFLMAGTVAPIGVALWALALLGGQPWAATWLHMQVAGGLAVMILAVMTRATLGHAGQDLVASPMRTAAYGALLGAALLRVFGGAALADPLTAQMAAAALWMLAFLLFLAAYAPTLVLTRADGKPG